MSNDAPMDENPLDESRFVEVFRAKDSPQAVILKQLLEDHDIPVMVEGELLQGVVGELPMGWSTSPKLLVEESHADAARELILGYEGQEIDRVRAEPDEDSSDADDENVCLSCGKAMSEVENKCAACGWSYVG